MKLEIKEAVEVILNTFNFNAKQNHFYDVDMFIDDVKNSIENEYTPIDGKVDIDDAECMVNFECAVIDVIREIDIYEAFGSAGCVIIVSELFDWAQEFFA